MNLSERLARSGRDHAEEPVPEDRSAGHEPAQTQSGWDAVAPAPPPESGWDEQWSADPIATEPTGFGTGDNWWEAGGPSFGDTGSDPASENGGLPIWQGPQSAQPVEMPPELRARYGLTAAPPGSTTTPAASTPTPPAEASAPAPAAEPSIPAPGPSTGSILPPPPAPPAFPPVAETEVSPVIPVDTVPADAPARAEVPTEPQIQAPVWPTVSAADADTFVPQPPPPAEDLSTLPPPPPADLWAAQSPVEQAPVGEPSTTFASDSAWPAPPAPSETPAWPDPVASPTSPWDGVAPAEPVASDPDRLTVDPWAQGGWPQPTEHDAVTSPEPEPIAPESSPWDQPQASSWPDGVAPHGPAWPQFPPIQPVAETPAWPETPVAETPAWPETPVAEAPAWPDATQPAETPAWPETVQPADPTPQPPSLPWLNEAHRRPGFSRGLEDQWPPVTAEQPAATWPQPSTPAPGDQWPPTPAAPVMGDLSWVQEATQQAAPPVTHDPFAGIGGAPVSIEAPFPAPEEVDQALAGFHGDTEDETSAAHREAKRESGPRWLRWARSLGRSKKKTTEEVDSPERTCPSCGGEARVDIYDPWRGLLHMSCDSCFKMWQEVEMPEIPALPTAE